MTSSINPEDAESEPHQEYNQPEEEKKGKKQLQLKDSALNEKTSYPDIKRESRALAMETSTVNTPCFIQTPT